MLISKKRIRVIKTVIIGFNILLFFIIALILIWFGKIRFEWSDELILKYKYEKNKSKLKRILVLGDSQLEKWPMRHCLYKDMERFCKKNDIGYVNAAHYGFGPIEYKDRLEYIAPDYKPNLIILFYYIGNDLTDIMLRDDQVPKKPTYDVVYIEGKSETQKKRKKRRSTFNWDYFKNKGIDSIVFEYARHNALNPHILIMSIWQPDYLFDNNSVFSIDSKYAWYKILQKFEDMLTFAEQINSEFCIVAIPSTVQVDSSHYDFYRKIAFNVSNELMYSNEPQRLLNDFASASAIKYLDLLPHFKNYSNTSELYFENDDHLSTAGHKLAFKLVKEEILTWFLDKNENYRRNERENNFYKNYTNWAIRYTMEGIKKDSSWFELVKKKAESKSISVDSMLFLDARYVVENLDSTKTLHN